MVINIFFIIFTGFYKIMRFVILITIKIITYVTGTEKIKLNDLESFVFCFIQDL